MVHFPGLARTRLCIQRAVSRVHRDGFPHSDISGSKPACDSPELFAACHVLHRLLAPRHPPYALSSLTIKLTQLVASPGFPSCKRNQTPGKSSKHFLSTFALLEQICSYAFAGLQGVNANFIQLSKNFSPTPGGVRIRLLQKIRSKTKNPASSAGCIRPHITGRIDSKLDGFLSGIRNQSHLVRKRKTKQAGNSRRPNRKLSR